MAVSPVSKIKLVVITVEGAKLVLSPAEFARMRLLPGMKVALLDETTGQTPKGLVSKMQGKDLLLELPEHGLVAKVEGFEEIADFRFEQDINAVTQFQSTSVAYAQAAPVTPMATDAGATTTTADKSAASASSGTAMAGFDLSKLAMALGALALAGAGGGGSSGGSGSGGFAIDGYLSGATVSRVNDSGNTVKTDANGRFTGLTGTGAIQVTGGIDQSTGQPFKGTLIAPEGSEVVTPLTTLIHALAGDGANDSQIQAATAEVLSKLGLPSDFDVLKVDPIALANSGDTQALEVFKAGVMVATALQVLSGGNEANFADAAAALTDALQANDTQTGVDLIISSLTTVASSVSPDLDVSNLVAALSTIDNIATVNEVVGAQATVLNQELDYTSTSSAITFTVNVNSGAKTVSFGAQDTATGPITVNVDEAGTATFSRAGVTAKSGPTQLVEVANFADEANYYKLDVPDGARLNINVSGGNATDDVFSIDAAKATQLSFAGNLGTGQDAVYIKVQDMDANFRILNVNTRGLSGAETVIFDFADVKDKVLLSADSYLANIATIEVKKGEADLHEVNIPEGTVFVVNSGLTLTLSQLLASESISSVTGLARLTVELESSNQITTPVLNSLANLNLIGLGGGEAGYIEIKWNGSVLASTQTGSLVGSNSAARNAILAIEGASLPSIPTLVDLVEDLQTQIDNLETEGAASILDVATDLQTLTATVASLDTAYKAADLALDTRLDAAEAKLDGITTTVTAAINAAVDALETQLLDGVSADFDTLKEVATELAALDAAITALDNSTDTRLDAAEAKLDGITTTVTAAINAAVDALETQLLDGVSADFDTLKEVATELAALDAAITALDNSTDTRLDAAEAKLDGITTTVTDAINAAVDALETQLLDGVSADFDTLKEVATELAALDAAITALDNSTDTRLDAAEAKLDGITTTVTAAINAAVDALETQLLDGVSADFDTLKEVATELAALDAAITALDNSTDTRLDAAEAKLDGITTTVTAAINAAVDALETQLLDGVSADFDTLKEVATELAALDAAITALDNSTDTRLDAAEAKLDGITTTVTDAINAAVDALETQLLDGVSADFDTLKEVATELAALDAAITALDNSTDTRLDAAEAKLDGITTTVTAAINAAVDALETQLLDGVSADFDTLKEVATELAALDAAITALDNSTDTRLDAAEAKLDGITTTVTAAINAAVDALETQLLDGVSADFDTLKEVATELAALDAAITALDNSTDTRLDAAEAKLDGITTTVTDAINAAVDALETQLLDGVSADFDTLKEVATELAALDAAITALDNSTDTRLDAAEAKLDGITTTVTAAINAAVDALETQLLDGVSADFDTLKEVATELAALDAAITALDNSTDTRLDAAEAKLDGITTTVTAAINAAVDALETQLLDGVSADFDTLKEVATELAALDAAITALDNSTDTRLDAAEAKLDGITTTVTDAINAAVDTLEESIQGFTDAGDYTTLKALSDDLTALDTLVTTTDIAVAGSVAARLDALQTTLEEYVDAFKDQVVGRGVELTVEVAQGLEAGDIRLVNYRINDSLSAILAMETDEDAVTNAKDIIVSVGTVSSAADAAKMLALGVNLVTSDYEVEGTAAALTTYSGGSAWPLSVLNFAENITATGTDADAANYNQAVTLLGLSNKGTTTIAELNVTAGQAQSLEFGVNDVVTDLVISGAFTTSEINLTNIPFGTNITFNGRAGNETLIVPEGEGTGGVLTITMGAGNDVIVIYGGDGTRVIPVDSLLDGGANAADGDTLVCAGAVDLSSVNIQSFEVLQMLSGSQSKVTMTAEQLDAFVSVTGDTTSEIELTNSESATTISGVTFEGIAKLTLGENVTLNLLPTQLDSIGLIVAEAENSKVSVNLFDGTAENPLPLDIDFDLDISTLTLDVDVINIRMADTKTLTLRADQINESTTLLMPEDQGAGNIKILGITGTVDNAGLYLANVDGADLNVTLVVTDTSGTVDLTANDYITNKIDVLQIAENAEVKVTSSQVSFKDVTGTDTEGSLIVVLEDNVNFDLGQIEIPATGLVSSSITLHGSANLDGLESTDVADGASLVLTADQADATTITASGTGVVEVTDADAENAYDFSELTAGAGGEVLVRYTTGGTLDAGTDWGTPGQLTIDVATGQTLTLTAAQATEQSIEGEGSVVVTGLTEDADLSTIAVSGTMTVDVDADLILVSAADLGDFEVTVSNTADLSLSASQANGVDITVDTGSVLSINNLELADTADLALISGTGEVTAYVSDNVTFTGDLGIAAVDVATGKTFTAAAAVVDDKTIGGEGNVSVTGLESTTDLSNIAAYGSKAVSVTSSITFTGDLETDFTVTVDDGVTLDAALTLLSGQKIEGAGSVEVTGLTGSVTADLGEVTVEGGVILTLVGDASLDADSSLAAVDLTIGGGFELDVRLSGAGFGLTATDAITVETGSTLKMTALQADGLSATGAGSVVLTALESALDADLSGLEADVLEVSAEVEGTVAFEGNLGNAALSITTGTTGELDVTGATIGASSSFDVGDGVTLRINAADVGHTITGTGSLAIEDLTNDIDLNALTVGEAAPVAQLDFDGDFDPANENWTFLDNAGAAQDGLPGTHQFSGTQLVLTGGTAPGAQEMNDLVKVMYSLTSGGTVSFSYSVTQNDAANEVFQYYNPSQQTSVTPLTTTGTVTLEVNSFDTIWFAINGDVANDSNASTVTITNFSFTPAGGVPGLQAVSATVLDEVVDISENETGADKIGTFDVRDGSTLKLSATQADGKVFNVLSNNGVTGSVEVLGLQDNLDADLSGLASALTTKATLSLTADDNLTLAADLTNVDTVEIVGPGTGTAAVTIAAGATVVAATYTVGAGATLSLSAADANTIGNITASGTGVVEVTDADAENAYDFSELTAGAGGEVLVRYTTGGTLDAGTDWGTPGQLTIDVATGQTLTLTAAQATEQSIEGEGSVVVTGLTEDADLSTIAVSGTMTVDVDADLILVSAADLGDFEVTVSNTADLSLSASQANGVDITVDTGSVLSINNLELADTADLALISGTGEVTAYVSDNVTFTGDLGIAAVDVATGKTFTAAAAVVDDKTIGGEGNVSVTGLESTTDLSNIAAYGSKAVSVTSSITFTGDLGTDFTVTVDDGVTLDAALTLLSGQKIEGAGSVEVTGLTGSVTADLGEVTVEGGVILTLVGDASLDADSSLAAVDLTIGGGFELDVRLSGAGFGLTATDAITVETGSTLKMTALQADGLSATGAGSVVLTALESALDADLSGLEADVLEVSAEVEGTVAFEGNLGNAALSITTGTTGELDVTGATIGASSSFDVGDGVTLRINAADVGHTITGTGSLAIEDLTNDIDLNALTVGEAAPVAQLDFDGDFDPANENWTFLDNAGAAQDGLPGTHQFSGTQLVLTGGTAPGAQEMNDLVKVMYSLTSGGTVSFSYSVTQNDAANEVFQYYNPSQQTSVTPLTTTGTVTLEVNSFDTIWFAINGDVANDSNASTVTITNFSFTPAGGVPGLQAVSATVLDEVVDISENETGADKIGTFDVRDGSTLKLSATQADGKVFNVLSNNGVTGSVEVLGLQDNLDADLSGLASALTTKATLSLTADDNLTLAADLTNVDTVEIVGPGTGTAAVTIAAGATVVAATYTVGAGATLSLSAADANTIGNITASGTGVVEVTDADAENAYDFSELTAGAGGEVLVRYTTGGTLDAGTDWGTPGQLTIDVATGQTLTLTAAQATEQSIEGEGTVNLSTTTLTGNLDVTNIANALQVDANAAGTLDVDIYTLDINADQIGDLALEGSGAVTVHNLADDSDLTLVTVEQVTAEIGNDVDISANTSLATVDTYSIAATKTLTVLTEQTAGVALSGSGTVIFSDTGTFTGTWASTISAQVADDQTLTISAALASAHEITGGSVLITGLDGSAYDLSNIAPTVSAIANLTANTHLDQTTALGEVALTIDSGHVLTMTAAQAVDRSITGDGSVTLDAAAVATEYDFSTVGVTGTVTVEFSAAGTVNGSTVFTDVDVVHLATGATTLSAEQANGLSFADSAVNASVVITGSAGVQALAGTAGDDEIATGAGADTVDISQGGNDTLVFDGSASDMEITGFVAALLDAEGDVLDFSAISGLSGSGVKVLSTTDNDLTMAQKVIVLEDVVGSAEAIATQFAQYGNVVAGGILNSQISAGESKIFVADAGDSGSPHSNVWRWTDAGGNDGNLQAGELQLLGTLEGLTKDHLANLTSVNFIL